MCDPYDYVPLGERDKQALVGITTAGLCQWFVLCDNPSTHTAPVPGLRDVPRCDRCAIRVGDTPPAHLKPYNNPAKEDS